MNTIHRRDFLRLGAGAAGHVALGKTTAQQNVSVVDFGADRTGVADATESVANALAHLHSSGGQVLFFPRGTYRLASVHQVALPFSNRSNLDVQGNGSTLVMGSDALCVALDRCANVQIRDLVIDWDPLPFTQGTVADSGIGWFEIRIDDGFPTVANGGILAIEAYDRTLRNIAASGVQISGDKVSTIEPAGAHRVRIHSSHLLPIATGTVMVVRFKGNHDAIRLTQCQNISFSGVTLRASYSMGYNITRSSTLSFRQCTIGFPTGGQRLLSTNADGMHITNCSGALLIDECTYQGMGDDAINVNAAMWQLRKQPNGGAMLVNRSGAPLSPSELPDRQDRLEILDPADLHITGHGSPGDLAATAPGSLIGDLDRIPTTSISRCQFLGNHSRAILAHARLQVKNSVFRNTSLAAIMIAPDDHWMEGPATGDILIDGNSFSGCHYASRDPEGTITVDVEQTYGRRGELPRGIAKNVQISNNLFNDCYTAAISCRSVDGLVIQGNQIGKTWFGGDRLAAIQAGELKNSTIRNNTSSAPNTIVVRASESTTVANNQGFS